MRKIMRKKVDRKKFAYAAGKTNAKNIPGVNLHRGGNRL